MAPFRPRLTLLLLAAGLHLAGCGTVTPRTAQQGEAPITPPYKGGGYYKDDGPGASPPDNLAAVPDAVPRWEPLLRRANDAYSVLGRNYVPIAAGTAYKQRGLASWYGRKFHGKPTSTGEPYDMYAMTAAHATLPLPSYARVTNLDNGKSVVVRVNDRGPFHDGRIIDLSYTAAFKLDILKGVTPVEVELVQPEAAPTSFSAQAEGEFIAPAAPAEAAQPVLAAVPAAPAPATPAQPAAAGAFYLQLGAFASPAKAHDLLDQATAILSREFPGVMRLENHGLYRVQAGPFASPEAAERAAGRVREALAIKPFRVAQAARAAEPAPGLYLQLAALSTPAAADGLASRVKHRFGAELPGLAHVSAGNLIKLQAGPFASPADAERLALAYQQDFGARPWRVTR